MIVRRVAACALIVLAVLVLSTLARDGGDSGPASDGRSAEPSALYHSAVCDGPSLEYVARQCGWWREPHRRTVVTDEESTRVSFWQAHRGPLASAPLLSESVTPVEVYAADAPHLPSIPAKGLPMLPIGLGVFVLWVIVLMPQLWNKHPG